MAISDNKQREMPSAADRESPRAEELAFKEAVHIINPVEPEFRGEVRYANGLKIRIIARIQESDHFVGIVVRWMISISIQWRTRTAMFMAGFAPIHPLVSGSSRLVMSFEAGGQLSKISPPMLVRSPWR